jgi:hypothetical protein
MAELDFLKALTDCNDISSIEDINDMYDYEDEYPNGEGDSPQIACGQTDNYNELKYIYRTKLKKHIDNGSINHQEAVEALCVACSILQKPRKRDDFYSKLEEQLEVSIT